MLHVPQLKTEMRKALLRHGRSASAGASRRAATIADPERIFYGTDWPFTPMAAVEDAASGLDATPLLEGSFGRRS
jgi:predicted TIM-barrel fold metal-dependent hydrolase